MVAANSSDREADRPIPLQTIMNNPTLPPQRKQANRHFAIKVRASILLALLALLLSGCRQPDNGTGEPVQVEEVTRIVTSIATSEGPAVEVTRIIQETVEVTATPTAAPANLPPKIMNICMTQEPASLYLYDNSPLGGPALAKQAVSHAIYENLYTTLGYTYQAQGIEKMPSLDDGDAQILGRTVMEGDAIIDADGRRVVLHPGVLIKDVRGDEVVFDGSPVEMPQMVVQFKLKPMVWSDGTPVSAADSVFSFQIAANPTTTIIKEQTERSESYIAVDDLTVQWSGLPGWLDPDYFTNIWPPLPAHQLGAIDPELLPQLSETRETPLSSGPFMVQSWVPGEEISLVKNAHYYRGQEGLPYLDRVNFRFVESREQLMALILAGECDIGTQDGFDLSQAPLLLEAEASGLLSAYFETNNLFEHIDFGINPDDAYAASRPDWFEDVRVRQGMILCTDRQAIADRAQTGLSQVAHAYIPASHPLFDESISQWPYDVAAANQLLDEVGFTDLDGDGIRQDPASSAPFQISLGINAGSEMRQEAALMFRENMADCGIDVTVTPHDAADWFASEGPLFGRRFDLAQFPWLTGMAPSCHLYLTQEIPSDLTHWQGNNETGWSHAPFDKACLAARSAFSDSEAYAINHREALAIFSQQLPIIPLFSHLKLAATRLEVINFNLDPSQNSELWNLFQLDISR